MQFEKKDLLPPALVFAPFAIAIASLMLSGLSVSNAISMQNGLTSVFLKSVQTSVVPAIIDSAVFVLQKAVLPLLPFLFFSTLGFSMVLWLKPDIKKLIAVLLAVEVVALAAVAAGQNPAMAIIPLGYFALLLPIEFEEKKTAFRSGYAFSSFAFRYLGIALAVAVFVAMLIMPGFDKAAEQEMVASINTFLPDINQLQQAQNEVASSFVNQAYSNVRNLVDSEYANLPSGKQSECSGFRNGISSGLDSYRSNLLSQLQDGNADIGTEKLAQDVFSKIGLFSAMAKALPLIAAISLFFLLEMLKPLLSSLGGAVYSLLARKFGK